MEPLRFPANRQAPRARVFNIIKERSFGEERIVLASGKESDFYFDMKPTMMHPEGASLLPKLILAALERVEFDCIGGLVMGAVPLITPVTVEAYNQDRSIDGFFVRQAAKDHGTKKLVEGLGSLQGRRAVILDDVTTTGASAMQAVEAVRKAGGEVAMVLTIVDREEGAVDFYREQGIPFTVLYTASEFRTAARS